MFGEYLLPEAGISCKEKVNLFLMSDEYLMNIFLDHPFVPKQLKTFLNKGKISTESLL